MLTDVMDFDPRIKSNGHGWHCNFHFGYGHDVIEDATNEKSCVQALQYLIAKADAEIYDLEDELAILQCQLKWAESDEKDPYEVCCTTFKQKINILSKSIENPRIRNILNERDLGTSLKFQRPAERIYDIINALTKQNFSVPDEQVEDLFSELDLHVNSGPVDIGPYVTQRETTSESCAESKRLKTDSGRQYKPADTVSEESCSDASRYVTRDSIETRDMGKADVEVTGKTEAHAFKRPPEGTDEFLTFLQVYDNNENTKSNALQHEENEECMNRSKNSGSGSSLLSAKTEVAVKVEEIDNDVNIQHVASEFFLKTQVQDSDNPVESHQAVKEYQSPSVDNTCITYEKKNSSLISVQKSRGQKVQRKDLTGVKQSNPRMLKPQGKIGKRQFRSNVDSLRQSNSPPSVVEERFCSLPETIRQRIPVDIGHANQPQLLVAKKQDLQGANQEDDSIQSQEVIFSREDDLCAQGNMASKPWKELVICLEAPCGAEGIASLLGSSPANPHNMKSKSTILKDSEIKDFAYDLESLRLKFSQEPDFVKKLKAPELKKFLKLNKVRGSSKFKKEKMIEELKNLLNAT